MPRRADPLIPDFLGDADRGKLGARILRRVDVTAIFCNEAAGVSGAGDGLCGDEKMPVISSNPCSSRRPSASVTPVRLFPRLARVH